MNGYFPFLDRFHQKALQLRPRGAGQGDLKAERTGEASHPGPVNDAEETRVDASKLPRGTWGEGSSAESPSKMN